MTHTPEGVVIQLTQGKSTIIDAEDAERVLAYKWCAARAGNAWYAVRSERRPDGRMRTIFLHRFIMGEPEGAQIDHREPAHTLDNRRANLRLATHAQNQANTRIPKTNKSGYKGVHRDKRTGRWRSVIVVRGKSHFLGLFDDVIAAARAYDAAARHHHGEFARCNFPEP